MIWWATNRREAQVSIRAELDDALARIVEQPRIGQLVPHTRLTAVRRRLLRRSRYYIYWRLVGDDIEILAFWHASRGSPPPL
jgi:plasmid stabilization system protein ParE